MLQWKSQSVAPSKNKLIHVEGLVKMQVKLGKSG
jgi:hypothetical protein